MTTRRKLLLWVVQILAAASACVLFVGSAGVAREEDPVQQNEEKLGFGLEAATADGVAGEDFVEGELIVGFQAGQTIGSARAADEAAQRLEQAVSARGGRVKKEKKDPQNPAVLVEFPSEGEAKTAAEALAAQPDVRFVERNGIVSAPRPPKPPEAEGKKSSAYADGTNDVSGELDAQKVSRDPLTGAQYHHTVIRKTAGLGKLSSRPPTVAVIDSGVDYTHPDLSGKIIKGPDYVNGDADPMDDHGHGTMVAGVVAAKAGNGIGLEGVSPDSNVLAIKVLNADNTGTNFDIAQALAYARTAKTRPATRVINLSTFGGDGNHLLADEVAALKAADKILVSIAGNDNTTDPTFAFPGADPNTALRVMATEDNDNRAELSNFSPAANPNQYNIAAPGWKIATTYLNRVTDPNDQANYALADGTSFAAPQVAGAAALLLGNKPALTRNQVINRLVSTGKPLSTENGFAGPTRRLDVRKALRGTPETTIVGKLRDPFTGLATALDSANTGLYAGARLLEADRANRGGNYEMTRFKAGTDRMLAASKSGYVAAPLREGIVIVPKKVAGPRTDALPQARLAGDATITVDWKANQPVFDTPGCVDTCNGWDFDLTVKLPDGQYVDPAFSKGSLTAAPFVHAPRDSFEDFRPLETAVIGGQAANGVYKVVADKWVSAAAPEFNPDWTGSEASVQIYDGAVFSFGGFKTPPANCGTSRYWYVGDLVKGSGTSYAFTPQNVCTDVKP